MRRQRAAVAAEDPDDPHSVAPHAPITDAERQAVLEHLLALGEGSEGPAG